MRVVLFSLVWIASLIVTIPFHLLGFIIIPFACIFKAYKKTDDNSSKQKDGATYHFTWFFMWFWDNESSDGIACRNYYESSFEKYGYLDMIVTTFVWSAMRNPINNWKRFISPKYDFNKLTHYGSSAYSYKAPFACWYLIWQDAFGGFYWSFHLFGKLRYIKIGYKFRPYAHDFQIPESQKNGVGSTFRIIPKTIEVT